MTKADDIQMNDESSVAMPGVQPSNVVGGPYDSSRRSFLRGVGKKTAYLAPVFLALSASKAHAASGEFDSTCGDAGSPCTANGDCCSNNCLGNMTCSA